MDVLGAYGLMAMHDELVPPDARVTLSVNYPNMMKFSVVNSRTKYDVDVAAVQRMENKTVQELFDDFYRLQNNDQAPDDLRKSIIEKALRELEEEA